MGVSREMELASTLLASLKDESFFPCEPRNIEDTGLPVSLIDSLVLKQLLISGTCSGRALATRLALPFRVLEGLFVDLRQRQLIAYSGSAPLNDYYYQLSDLGRGQAQAHMKACAYVGTAPVPLVDYIVSVEAQSIRAERPQRRQLETAFQGITVDPSLMDMLGPAVNSGAGMMLYGAPGNGKSTLAQRMTMCFGHRIWMPRVILEDGQIIKVFDPAYHAEQPNKSNESLRTRENDQRWVCVRRPTVVVGGELTMDSLEIRHDPRSNLCEAPLQVKSNCGCLLIDDFGRQRVEPRELLNRWIIPLEERIDYLTLPTGKKIQLPFEQLVIFSTNLEPGALADDAFLRRIPYKIEIPDPDEREYIDLFRIYANVHECKFDADAVQHFLSCHMLKNKRALRRCQPRDLLDLIRNYCAYHGYDMEMTSDNFDRVVDSYFTTTRVARAPSAMSSFAVPKINTEFSEDMATRMISQGAEAPAAFPLLAPPFADASVPV